jgi:hypothetical protein
MGLLTLLAAGALAFDSIALEDGASLTRTPGNGDSPGGDEMK